MTTPPTFVASYESAWPNTTTPKTTSVTVDSGDQLAVFGVTYDTAITLSAPTGGALTYALVDSLVLTSRCSVYVWTATASSSQTFTMSVARNASLGMFGFNCLRYSGSDGFGVHGTANASGNGPNLNLTPSDNSALAVAVGDWNAVDGASRVWRTVNGLTPTSGNGMERTYMRSASNYTVYVGYWSDAGAAGSKTVGLSAPNQQWTIVGLEVLGSAGSPPPAGAPRPVVSSTAVHRAASW